MNPVTMAHTLASIREQLHAAAEQALAAPQYVRAAFGKALHAVDRALKGARDSDPRLDALVADALHAIQLAQDAERDARSAAVAQAVASARPRPRPRTKASTP